MTTLRILLPSVAVGSWVGKKIPILVQQAVIYTPCVDAKAVKLAHISLPKGKKAELKLLVKIRQIPIEHTVHFDIVVFKTMKLMQSNPCAIESAQDGTAITCT